MFVKNCSIKKTKLYIHVPILKIDVFSRNFFLIELFLLPGASPFVFVLRNDEKTAADYKIQGGSVLHLVLALRGGQTLRSSRSLHYKPAL